MRKVMPLIATALVSVLITAGIMQATAGAHVDPTLRATGLSPSRLIGADLNLASCDPTPSNASEWTKFAKCAAGNFTAVRKWATKLDACMTLYRIERRNNFATTSDGGIFVDGQTDGLAEYNNGGASSAYLMQWKDLASCPKP